MLTRATFVTRMRPLSPLLLRNNAGAQPQPSCVGSETCTAFGDSSNRKNTSSQIQNFGVKMNMRNEERGVWDSNYNVVFGVQWSSLDVLSVTACLVLL